MKKIITIFTICVLEVVTLRFLMYFDVPYKELVFSAVSIIFLFFGCLLLRFFNSGKKTVRFLKLMPLRGADVLLIFWFSLLLISGSFVLNFFEVLVWDKLGIQVPSNGFNGMSFSNIGEMILVVALLPAIFEELFFRGAVLSSVEKKGIVFAVAISSVSFFVMHGSYYYILSTLFAGIVLCSVVYTTRSVLASIIVHFLNNLLSYILYIYSSRLSVSGFDIYIVYGLIFVFLISIYGVLSARITKIKSEKDNSIKLYNEGELVWQTRKKRKKRAK